MLGEVLPNQHSLKTPNSGVNSGVNAIFPDESRLSGSIDGTFLSLRGNTPDAGA
jgi:hypothetical protein